MVNAGFVMHSKIEGSQPFYRDERGNQHYITSIGISKEGKPYAVVRSNQSVMEGTRSSTHLAHEVIPMNEIPLNGLSNASQAAKIRNTFQQMLPYAQTLSLQSNQPGVAPPPAGAAGVDQSLFNLSQLQPDKDSPEYRQFVDAQNFSMMKEEDPFAFVRVDPGSLEGEVYNDFGTRNIHGNFQAETKPQQIERLKLMAIQGLQGGLSQWNSLSDNEKVDMMLGAKQSIIDAAGEEMPFANPESRDYYKRKYFGDVVSEYEIRQGISENPNPRNPQYNTPVGSHISFTIEPSQTGMDIGAKDREEIYDMSDADFARYAVDVFASRYPTIGQWHRLSDGEKFQLIKRGKLGNAEALANREGFSTSPGYEGVKGAIMRNEDAFTYPIFADIARMSYYNYGDQSSYMLPIEQPSDSYIKKAIEEQKKLHEEQGLVPPPPSYNDSRMFLI